MDKPETLNIVAYITKKNKKNKQSKDKNKNKQQQQQNTTQKTNIISNLNSINKLEVNSGDQEG